MVYKLYNETFILLIESSLLWLMNCKKTTFFCKSLRFAALRVLELSYGFAQVCALPLNNVNRGNLFC